MSIEIKHRYTGAVLFTHEGADLHGADLHGADLRGADLHGADLRGAIGNGRELKTLQTSYWQVAYSATHMAIGCQQHAITDWWTFTDVQIHDMDSKAFDFWQVWKPILQKIIEVSPATPTGYEQ